LRARSLAYLELRRHYLLFLVNDNGVPSVGKIIRIQ